MTGAARWRSWNPEPALPARPPYERDSVRALLRLHPSSSDRARSRRWYLGSGQPLWPPLRSTGAGIAIPSTLISTLRDSLPDAFPGEGES